MAIKQTYLKVCELGVKDGSRSSYDPGYRRVIGQLEDAGLSTFATTMDGEVNLAAPGETLAQPTAWLLGNEAHGLDDDILSAADHRVSIPIQGSAESLNLATAASVCLYESAFAQRAAPAG